MTTDRLDRPSRSSTVQRPIALLAVAIVIVVLASGSDPNGTAAASAAATDVYQYAGECVRVRDLWSNRYVGRDGTGYTVQTRANAATAFRMQATRLGSYLLYGPDTTMPGTGASGLIESVTKPGPRADWTLSAFGPALQLTNVSTGRHLSVDERHRLVQRSDSSARWRLEATNGCATFPELAVNVDGSPTSRRQRQTEVRGLVDAHVHPTAFEFLGGLFHCGRPWSPYGAADALTDCPDHGLDGSTAWAENLLSAGTLFGTHSVRGWPDFDGWPRHDSLTHEGTYWKAIERAWRGGLRIMVADLVENRALCELYWLKKNPCGDMDSLRLQARALYALEDYIDAQFKGPGRGFFRIVKSPREARAVIADGKLAVVMGVETSQPFDCLYRDGVEPCTEAQIDRGLDELWNLGVRSLFPVHKFDNPFGGTAMDSGVTGLLVNIGNLYMTGRWWEVGACPGTDGDSTPLGFEGAGRPVCNVRSLTTLGEHLINRMIDKGMIIETDHMSVRTRARALTIIESRGYSGVITSHSWGDDTSLRRIQALGGFVAPYATTATDFVARWQKARATKSGAHLWGIGFGTDTNGLGAQAAPRFGASVDRPVTYPFLSFDDEVTIQQSEWNGRRWDFNLTGAAHYGLFLDWVEDLKHLGGPEILDDVAQGAEAYLQMWERASSARGF